MPAAAEIMIAVLAAVAAACSFGAGAALQHQQAHQAATARLPPARLLPRLARRPRWLAGIALAAAAYGLQAVALAFGPLALVAPIVATDLVFGLVLTAWWSQRRLHVRDWTGCGLVCGGVASFLVTSPPSSGRSGAPAWAWLLAFSPRVAARWCPSASHRHHSDYTRNAPRWAELAVTETRTRGGGGGERSRSAGADAVADVRSRSRGDLLPPADPPWRLEPAPPG
jgi:hypothetical protein